MRIRTKLQSFVKTAVFMAVLVASGFAPDAYGQLYAKFGPSNGIMKGNVSTPQTTVALSSDVVGLWSGTCDSTHFLGGDGTCAIPAGTAPSGAANLAYATPNGAPGAATLRALVGADIPPINLGSTANGGVSSATILLGTNGGTSNGFFSITGPATSLKTFTFPNASATVLTSNAAVTVPQGGTGAVTLTGLLKGSGTSALSAAASADIISLWSGSCSSSNFLRGDGTCVSPGSGSPGGANTNIQFNNAGSFGGDSGLTYAGSGGDLIKSISTNGTTNITNTNTSTGTAAAGQFKLLNSADNVALGLTSTGFSGSIFTGGPSGEQIFLGGSNAAVPITFAVGAGARMTFGTGVAGRQVDFIGTTATSAAVVYAGWLNQAGTRFGYMGKTSTGSLISYESDADVSLIGNNGADAVNISTGHVLAYNGVDMTPTTTTATWSFQTANSNCSVNGTDATVKLYKFGSVVTARLTSVGTCTSAAVSSLATTNAPVPVAFRPANLAYTACLTGNGSILAICGVNTAGQFITSLGTGTSTTWNVGSGTTFTYTLD